MSSDDPVDVWRAIHRTLGQRVRLIYTILAPRAGAANPAQSTEREDFTNVRITPLKVLWIQS